MKARDEVEDYGSGEYELPDEGYSPAKYLGIGEPKPGAYPIKSGPRKGEIPNRTYFKFALSDGTEVRSTWFDMDNPHEEIVVSVQNALAGREVGDSEAFDFGPFEDRGVVDVFIVHNTREKGAHAGKTFADVTKARPRKKAKQAPPAEPSFPDGDEDDIPF